MRIFNATNKVLANYGLIATEQDIKRAYAFPSVERFTNGVCSCKRKGGFNIGLDHQSYILAEYLQLNRIAAIIKPKTNDSSI